MDSKVSQFERSVRRMLEAVEYYDDAKRLLKLVKAVSERERLDKANPQAELRTHAFKLILKLGNDKKSELINPLLCDLANASRIPGYILRVTGELMPVVLRLMVDPCKPNNRVSWSSSPPPPNSCS